MYVVMLCVAMVLLACVAWTPLDWSHMVKNGIYSTRTMCVARNQTLRKEERVSGKESPLFNGTCARLVMLPLPGVRPKAR